MRIEAEQIRAIVAQLAEWRVLAGDHALIARDLIAEFDTLSNAREDSVGKFSRTSLTSKQSAMAIKPRTGTLRRRVLDVIGFSGERGLTRDEIAEICHMSPNSVRPRVSELMEGGWIRDSGRTRKNENDLDCEILILTEAGRRNLIG